MTLYAGVWIIITCKPEHDYSEILLMSVAKVKLVNIVSSLDTLAVYSLNKGRTPGHSRATPLPPG